MKLNTTLGYYTPAFFRIHINTNSHLSSFNERDLTVFIHEYIHFVQDITTYYGLNNMYAYSEYIRFATYQFYKSKNKEIILPILPNNENQDNVYLNVKLNKLTNGDSTEIKNIKEIKNIEVINEPTGLVGSAVDNISSVCLTVIDNENNEHTVLFGAYCIMESMAYLLEKYLAKKHIESSDFPYSIAEIITKKVHPEFAENNLNIIALCDTSLMFSNPGSVFYDELQEMVLNKWVPDNPEDIYDRIYFKKTLLNNKKESTVENVFKSLSSLVVEQLKGYFNDNSFHKLNNWIEQIVQNATELRFSNKYFIIELARGGKALKNKVFNYLIKNRLGTPMISNQNGESGFYWKNNNKREIVDIPFLSVIMDIAKLFESGNRNCTMKSICSYENIKVDKRCDESPWTRTESYLFCPFGILWKHWNLKKYTVIINS